MGKKKKDKKGEQFSKTLKENAKKIMIMDKGEERSLSSITEESVENIVATGIDSIIPVSATEAANESMGGEGLHIGASYSHVVFSTFESALKWTAKQSIIEVIDASYIGNPWSLKHPQSQTIDILRSRTNISLIFDQVPDKVKKRLSRFIEGDSEKDIDTFVIKIPNVVMFYDCIRKKELTNSKLFDLVLIIVKSRKNMTKLKEKNGEKFKEVSSNIVGDVVKTISNLALSSVHMGLDDEFFTDPHWYASAWMKEILGDKALLNILKRIEFCTNNIDTLAQFNVQINAEIPAKKGIEIL